jgi:hypothetical protein
MKRVLLMVSVMMLAACGGQVGKTGPAGMNGTAGEPGPVGPAGPGFAAPASISAVVPRFVVPGQTVDVTISGFATTWTAQSVVSMGAGMKVNSIRLGSGTSIVANVTCAPDALPGARDVSVRTMGATVSYKAFEIKPYITLTVVGVPKQGSLVTLHIEVNDPMFGFAEKVEVTSTAGFALKTLKGLTRTRDVLFGIHPGADLMSQSITVKSAEFTKTFEGILTPEQQAPIPLPELPATIAFSGTESQLFSMGASMECGNLEGNADIFMVFSRSDKWDASSSAGKFIPIGILGTMAALDLGATGMSTLAKTSFPATLTVTDTEPNDTLATAQVANALEVNIPGTFTGSTDKDYYTITLPAGCIGGKKIKVESVNAATDDIYITVTSGSTAVIPRRNVFGTFSPSVTSAAVVPATQLEVLVEPYGATKLNYTLKITFL